MAHRRSDSPRDLGDPRDLDSVARAPTHTVDDDYQRGLFDNPVRPTLFRTPARARVVGVRRPLGPRLKPAATTDPRDLGALVRLLDEVCCGVYRFGLTGDGSLTVARGDFDVMATLPPWAADRVDRFGNALAHVLLAAPAPVTVDYMPGTRFVIAIAGGPAIDLTDLLPLADGSLDGDSPIGRRSTALGTRDRLTYDVDDPAPDLDLDVDGWCLVAERVLDALHLPDATHTGVSELTYRREAAPQDSCTLRVTYTRNRIVKLEVVRAPDAASSGAPRAWVIGEGGEDGSNSELVGRFLDGR